MWKKLISWALSFSMVSGLLPLSAVAAPSEVRDIAVGAEVLHMCKIPAGSFLMGRENADGVKEYDDHISYDEAPVHRVTILEDYYLASTEVTNRLFELYAPEHKQVRGTFGYNNMFNDLLGTPIDVNVPSKGTYRGFSSEDNEAAVFVSWNEASAFCDWLNENYLPADLKAQGYEFRLPTEAEWEYACRAGSTTAYWYGDTFREEEGNNQYTAEDEALAFYPDPSRGQTNESEPLTVGTGEANPYGLYNMHGNVEEWCQDWYGSFAADDQTDPVGRESGDSKVTRGGSHSTMAHYLTSSNRSSSIPTDRNWMIGFRVALGKPLDMSKALPREDGTKDYQQNVTQTKANKPQIDQGTPYYDGPKSQEDSYVRNAYPGDLRGSNRLNGSNEGPFYRHNHQPAIVECPNGDLLAIWYTGSWENRRELNYAVSRKPYNQKTNTYGEWSDADLFFDTADRNNHGAAILSDGETLYSICGQADAAAYGPLVLTLRTSDDNGATWSDARIITPEYEVRHQAIGAAFVADNGDLVLTCDACSSGSGGTALWISKDKGQTWTDAGAGSYNEASSIKGIHASVVDLMDENSNHYYMGLGRNDFYARPESEKIPGVNYPEHEMSMSVTYDEGKTYTYSGTGLIGVESGQRLVLRKLDNGNLLLVSFTGKRDNNTYVDENKPSDVVEFGQDMESYQNNYIELVDENGVAHKYYGAYAAISEDGGKTWPYKRILTDITDDEVRVLNGYGNTKEFKMTQYMAEPKGYLTGIQTSDGMIHVLSSAFEYTFNEAWVKDGPADLNALKMMVGEAKQVSAAGYTAESWANYQKAISEADAAANKAGVTASEIKAAYQALHDAENALIKTFLDVSADAWYASSVQQAVDQKLMSGTSATTFSPNAPFSRAMLIQILYGLAGQPDAPAAGFSDVAASTWYANAVNWAADQGIVAKGSSFAPDRAVTRQEMAQILSQYAKLQGVEITASEDALSPYQDCSSVADWASGAMAWAVESGLISGRSAQTLAPADSVTRAEGATILLSFVVLLK